MEKVRILVYCSYGVSANVFVQKMKKVVEEHTRMFKDCEVSFMATGYVSIEQEIDNCDIAVLSPFANHIAFIEPYCKGKGKLCIVLDKGIYAQMDGLNATKIVHITYLKSLLNKRSST